MKKHFNSDFMKLRVMAGLTQKQLAAELGVSRDAVSQWERGVRKPLLSPAQWKALCKALNVTAEQIPDYFGPIDQVEGSK